MPRGRSRMNSTFAVLSVTDADRETYALERAGFSTTAEAMKWIEEKCQDSVDTAYVVVNVKRAVRPVKVVTLEEEGGASFLGVAEADDDEDEEDEDSPDPIEDQTVTATEENSQSMSTQSDASQEDLMTSSSGDSDPTPVSPEETETSSNDSPENSGNSGATAMADAIDLNRPSLSPPPPDLMDPTKW